MIDKKAFEGHTAGPWGWFNNYGRPMLATPDRGRLIIMDFVRKGMQGAMPRFAKRSGDEGGIMYTYDELLVVSGQSPDANLIDAAPTLLLENTKLCELVRAQQELIALYSHELAKHTIYLAVHGFETSKRDIDEGERLRTEITALKDELGWEGQDGR